VSGGPTSEHELIRSARAGDQDAFAELVTIHADRVYGALRRFGLDASDADEVTQDVFLRAWRGLARFEERAKFSTRLYRIAFNEAQRRLSRRAPPRAEADPGREDSVTIGRLRDPCSSSRDATACRSCSASWKKIAERY